MIHPRAFVFLYVISTEGHIGHPNKKSLYGARFNILWLYLTNAMLHRMGSWLIVGGCIVMVLRRPTCQKALIPCMHIAILRQTYLTPFISSLLFTPEKNITKTNLASTTTQTPT